ncbi:yls2-like [Stylosanthes scabra]|uniref:Yls2-like n=1 Tax=Stylosanthes scabra TaxID=79078 RepID=A0ABU6RFV1_9FABA|nr:yls2-like [Stylosanthes scabra]
MSNTKGGDSASQTRSDDIPGRRRTRPWFFTMAFFFIVLPVIVAVVFFRLDRFKPVQLPVHDVSQSNSQATAAVARNHNMRRGSEVIGNGRVLGPEDLAYALAENVIYTGCVDGWVKRVKLSDDSESDSAAVVEDWVNTGGRPLGVALDQSGSLIVSNSEKGLLRIRKDNKKVEILTDEVDGLKFKLTNGVDVAKDGTIYFTDASYKYSLKEFPLDLFEGRPHGRLMSYNPTTKETKVLAHDLYFPNGVAVSPDQQFVIFCETPLLKCKKYYIEGPKKGSIDKFCDDIPGYPDNIHYDGEGHYWIGLVSGTNPQLDVIFRYPLIRKAIGMFAKLTDEVNGLKLKLTDGVDVAKDGMIYFTDASYKYSFKDHFLDLLEGKPHGRLMSYNPTTNKTKVLAHDLYFPNGVAVSPDQKFVIFCESVLMKCKKYYIEGSKKGIIEKFCDDLPGFPDNIHYDGQGQYWIGIGGESSPELEIIFRYPLIRKAIGMFAKYVMNPSMAKNGGVISLDLDGKPIGHYSDPKLSLASGIKIGDHIYCGSLNYPFILRLDVKKYPAINSSSSKN